MHTVQRHGFAIVSSVIGKGDVHRLRDAIDPLLSEHPVAGIRGLANKLSVIRALSYSPQIRRLVDPILNPEARLVRSILFNKGPKVNWKVTWHQDISIAVQPKVDIPGFGPWSEKDGISHVQAPESVLENMLTVRIHLDPADETSGALWMSPGSHTHGRLPADRAAFVARKQGKHLCAVQDGDALLFRPLVLHCSHKASIPRQRRVIHLEYSSAVLPRPLTWNAAA